MIQFIFPYDSIDEGRKKIDSTFFSGYTPNGYWKSLNSGNTGFSLEFTASTAGISNNNSDTSTNSNNIIVGNNNTIIGNGGYNFLKGKNNLINGSSFSYVDGELITISANTSSFIFARNFKISGDTNSSFINVLNSEIYPNFKINYGTLFGGAGYNFIGNNSLSTNNFLLGINSIGSYITGTTNYFTTLNGALFNTSGDVKHCVVTGTLNNIGYNHPVASNGSHQNIFIFGSGITPSLSATSITSLSGTYANSVCIEDKLIFRKKQAVIPPFSKTATTQFINNNLYQVNEILGNNLTATSHTLSNIFHLSTTASSIFFIVFIGNNPFAGSSLSGSPNVFVDDYGYNNRIEISTNLYSANTAFYGYSHNLQKYIKYRG